MNTETNEDQNRQRFIEETIEPEMLKGSLNLIKSFIIEYKIEAKVDDPINHPDNLDQIINHKTSFQKYCRTYKFADDKIVMSIAFAFNDYMVKHRDCQLLIDTLPEHPLQTMCLKYTSKSKTLYPLEIALTVMRKEKTFNDFLEKIDAE